jgi:hypothetical protein
VQCTRADKKVKPIFTKVFFFSSRLPNNFIAARPFTPPHIFIIHKISQTTQTTEPHIKKGI